MEFFKEWTISVCATVLVATIFSVIVPEGNMKKLCKIIIGFFIFVSFFLPFTNLSNNKLKIDFDFASVQSDVNEEITKTSEKQIKTQTESTINSMLEKNGYIGCITEVSLNLKSDEVNINSIKITIPTDYNKNEVAQYIRDELGLNATIYYNGE